MSEIAYVPPAIQTSGVPDSRRHSALVRLTHWVFALSFLGLVVSGVAIILAHPRYYWGETGSFGTPSLFYLPLPTIPDGPAGWGRSLHFLSTWIAVIAGALYGLSGILTQHFRRKLWPASADLSLSSLRSSILDHLRFRRPAAEDSYNILQRVSYLSVIFLLFPLMIMTGLAMSPVITSVIPQAVTIFGGHQSARTIHFFLANVLLLFLLVHIAMVIVAGFPARMRAMIAGRDRMSDQVSRRKLIVSGLVAATGASGLVYAGRQASRYGLIPPDSGGIWGVGETLTYATQRILMAHHSLAREFQRSEVSRVIPVNGEPPRTQAFERLMAGGFADWRLTVDGMVDRPSTFSLAELKRFPPRSQITHQACEAGWSFIAEWTGVPLSYVLNLVGVHAQARYVVFFPFDDFWDSLDLPDAMHPQTLLAYGLNGQDLPTGNGAPLRLRVTRQLGYKSIKYLSHIRVADNLKNIGTGQGSVSPDTGYSWFAGI